MTPAGPAHLVVAPEVASALRIGAPVVALESTIIAHGLPWPTNLQVARALEAAVRPKAVPATIAVIAGRYRVGLNADELESLARHSERYQKVALRDLPAMVASGSNGATTVSATAHIASLAGICVFATGGVGGVHRGALDVSQDILALATKRIVVVSAGVKSVLNVPATLEALEAVSVPVMVWRSKRFPDFYTADSGCAAPARVDSAAHVARTFLAASELNAGMLLAVPIPSSEEGDSKRVQAAVERALVEVKQTGVKGKAVTPFLLARVAELSGGESMRANVSLAKNNARVAALVAAEISHLRSNSFTNAHSTGNGHVTASPQVVVAGVAAVDIIAKAGNVWTAGSSNPGRVHRAVGGVACNMARAAAMNGARVAFAGAVGDDAEGGRIHATLQAAGVDVRSLRSYAQRTPIYCALHDAQGELTGAVADMDVPSSEVFAATFAALQRNPRVLVLDANLSASTIADLCHAAKQRGVQVFFEPTSVAKCVRIIPALANVMLISPNSVELEALSLRLGSSKDADEEQNVRKLQSRGVRAVVVTRGARGAALYDGEYPPYEIPAANIAVHNTSGAGDALMGTLAAHVASHGDGHDQLCAALRAGMTSAARVCSSPHSGVDVAAKL